MRVARWAPHTRRNPEAPVPHLGVGPTGSRAPAVATASVAATPQRVVGEFSHRMLLKDHRLGAGITSTNAYGERRRLPSGSAPAPPRRRAPCDPVPPPGWPAHRHSRPAVVSGAVQSSSWTGGGSRSCPRPPSP